MVPRHDEILKTTDDGFTIAWDKTIRMDDARIKAIEMVVEGQANELGAIFGAPDVVIRDGDNVTIIEAKDRTRPPVRGLPRTPR